MANVYYQPSNPFAADTPNPVPVGGAGVFASALERFLSQYKDRLNSRTNSLALPWLLRYRQNLWNKLMYMTDPSHDADGRPLSIDNLIGGSPIDTRVPALTATPMPVVKPTPVQQAAPLLPQFNTGFNFNFNAARRDGTGTPNPLINLPR